MEDTLFFIDTGGTVKNKKNKKKIATSESLDNKCIKQALKEFWEERASQAKSKPPEEPKPKTMVEQFFEDMGWTHKQLIEQSLRNPKHKPMKKIDLQKDLIEQKSEVKKLLEKSAVLKKEFHTAQSVPTYDLSDKKLKKQRKEEREKTKGKKWFDLPATEVTEEVKKDLEVLQMRSVLDPKHFYKKNDLKVLPKYFQIGRVEDTALDYHNRLTKKERKRTLVDELMADAEFNKYNKRKYNEIVVEKQKTHYGAYRAAKKLKRRKK